MNQESHQRIKSIVHAIPVSKMEFIVKAQSNEDRGIIISIIEISHITIFIKSKYARRRTKQLFVAVANLEFGMSISVSSNGADNLINDRVKMTSVDYKNIVFRPHVPGDKIDESEIPPLC